MCRKYIFLYLRKRIATRGQKSLSDNDLEVVKFACYDETVFNAGFQRYAICSGH